MSCHATIKANFPRTPDDSCDDGRRERELAADINQVALTHALHKHTAEARRSEERETCSAYLCGCCCQLVSSSPSLIQSLSLYSLLIFLTTLWLSTRLLLSRPASVRSVDDRTSSPWLRACLHGIDDGTPPNVYTQHVKMSHHACHSKL